MAAIVAILALVATLAAAVLRPRLAPDWLVATVGAVLLLATGIVDTGPAGDAIADLAPTIAFLAALLVLADGCRRAGLFDAAGDRMARRADGDPRRLLGQVFLVSTATTVALSLDATAVLLTPIVVATAVRLRTPVRPHGYAVGHLANSASLLLPVSNLTNLIAFEALDLSPVRFTALMAGPWLVAIAIEWFVLRRVFAHDLDSTDAATGAAGTEAGHEATAAAGHAAADEPTRVIPDEAAAAAADHGPRPIPRFAVTVASLTLIAFVVGSEFGIPAYAVAIPGALILALQQRTAPVEVVQAAKPGFLLFVLALAVIVAGVGEHGLASLVTSLLPAGETLPALLAIAVVAAVLANVVNNLPAILILLPILVPAGAAPVLAALIGVNVGPNLTLVGSLATLLWRRILQRQDVPVPVGEFTKLGLLTVPAILIASTLALWLALQL